MLPRLKQWLEQAVFARSATRPGDGSTEFPSSFMCDDKLSVSESTITEYSRAIAAFEPQRPSQCA